MKAVIYASYSSDNQNDAKTVKEIHNILSES